MTVWWYCNKPGRFKARCYKHKRKQNKCRGNNDDSDNAMVAKLGKESPEKDLALSVWHTSYIDSRVTAYKVKDDAKMFESKVLMKIAIGTAGF